MAYYALKVARGRRELLTDYSGTNEDYFQETASIEFNQTIISCHERNIDITPALLQRYGIQEIKNFRPSIGFYGNLAVCKVSQVIFSFHIWFAWNGPTDRHFDDILQ